MPEGVIFTVPLTTILSKMILLLRTNLSLNPVIDNQTLRLIEVSTHQEFIDLQVIVGFNRHYGVNHGHFPLNHEFRKLSVQQVYF